MSEDLLVQLVGNPKENPRKRRARKHHKRKKHRVITHNPHRKMRSRAGRRAITMIKINGPAHSVADRVADGAIVGLGAIGAQIGLGLINEKLIKPTTRFSTEDSLKNWRDYGEPAVKAGIGVLFEVLGKKGTQKSKKLLTLAAKGAYANAVNDLAEPLLRNKVPGYRTEPSQTEKVAITAPAVGGYLEAEELGGYVETDELLGGYAETEELETDGIF